MNSEVPGGKHQRIVKMIIALHKHLNIPTDRCQEWASHFAVCAKFRPLASHETPWRHSKIPHRCETGRHGRSGDHKRVRRRVL